MNDRVKIEMKDGVADVRLVRTDKMNALDDAMFGALVDAGEQLKEDRNVRAVVLSGEGRAFCAGLDMGNFGAMASGDRRARDAVAAPPARTDRGANRAQQAVLVWREVPVPVIAAVHGVAFGGGFQLALGADMRYVAPDTRMAILEIKWGLVPDMAGFVLMKHLVREDKLRELTYTGRIFTGEEAYRIGFATRACADPLSEALATAAEIASKNPHAQRANKRLFDVAATTGDEGAILRLESKEQGALIGSPNQIEAVMSNMQKRDAKYAEV